MTIFEKREWRKWRRTFLTNEYRRREQKKNRILRKIEKIKNQAEQRIARLRKQYDIVWRRPYDR